MHLNDQDQLIHGFQIQGSLASGVPQGSFLGPFIWFMSVLFVVVQLFQYNLTHPEYTHLVMISGFSTTFNQQPRMNKWWHNSAQCPNDIQSQNIPLL